MLVDTGAWYALADTLTVLGRAASPAKISLVPVVILQQSRPPHRLPAAPLFLSAAQGMVTLPTRAPLKRVRPLSICAIRARRP